MVSGVTLMKITTFILPVFLTAAGLMLTVTPSAAKPEFSKKEKKGCATCHVTAKSKDLNDTGKCYKDKKSLDCCEVK